MPVCLILIFIFGIPLVVGLRLWRQIDSDGFAQLAGALTLTPLITAIPWFLIASSAGSSGTPQISLAVFSVLPGAGLTLLAICVFWNSLTGAYPKRAWFLIGLDCLRWGNSFLTALTGSVHIDRPIGSLVHGFALLGMLFPALFAGVAVLLTRSIALELPPCPQCGQLLQPIDAGQGVGDSRPALTLSSRAQALLVDGYVWACESCQRGWKYSDVR